MHMSDQAEALADTGAGEDDYAALLAVLSSTACGRAFLTEHARRSRHADVEALLCALERLENGAQPQADLATLSDNVARLAELVERLRGELPVKPQPAASATAPVSAPPSLALAAVAAQALASAAGEPELRVFKAGSIQPPVRFAGSDFSSNAPNAGSPPDASVRDLMPPLMRSELPDPLASIVALSEDERLALFG
jgi:hypothetical protein